MGKKEDNIKKAKDLMNKLEYIRNIGIAAHIDHGKTTLSDNLLAGCGMMSEELAGKTAARLTPDLTFTFIGEEALGRNWHSTP